MSNPLLKGSPLTINVPVVLYGVGRNDFDAGKFISRAIGRCGL